MAEKKRTEQEKTTGKYWEPDGTLENSTNPKMRMEQMKNILEHSEKGGLFKKNSALFDRVSECMRVICDMVGEKLRVMPEKALEQLKELDEKYGNLIEACERYLDRTSRTTKGQNRQRMVGYIRNLAQKDRQALSRMSGDVLFGNNLYTTSGSTRTISDLMATMRTKVIEMGEGEHGTVGGASSSLTVLDKEKDGIEGFFSERKVINRDIDAVAEEFLENAFKEKNIDAKKALLIREELGAPREGWFSSLRFWEWYKKDAEIKAFVEDMEPAWKAIYTSHLNAFTGYYANLSSDSFDSNARNVATSRIAELFGVGRLVAKSEMVELRKPGEKTGQMGSVMEKAKGEAAEKLIPQVIGMALQKKDLKSEEGKRELRWKSNDMDFKQGSYEAMKGLITGNFMRDMSDLQVLDYLCGQIDRHDNNFFIMLNEEGKLDSVQGIDNDLSFGAARYNRAGKNVIGNHGRRVVSDEGDLFIPHMSRSFAEAIDAVDETMVRFVLADLIEASDIDAFCQRLAILKKAVAKELQKKPEESKLLGDDEWKDNKVEDFLNAESQSGEMSDEPDYTDYNAINGTSNYIGNLFGKKAIVSSKTVYDHYKGQDK